MNVPCTYGVARIGGDVCWRPAPPGVVGTRYPNLIPGLRDLPKAGGSLTEGASSFNARGLKRIWDHLNSVSPLNRGLNL